MVTIYTNIIYNEVRWLGGRWTIEGVADRDRFLAAAYRSFRCFFSVFFSCAAACKMLRACVRCVACRVSVTVLFLNFFFTCDRVLLC